MSVLDSFGALVGGILASIVLLVFAVLTFFITVFILQAGVSLRGDFVVFSAAVFFASPIIAGASPMLVLSARE